MEEEEVALAISMSCWYRVRAQKDVRCMRAKWCCEPKPWKYENLLVPILSPLNIGKLR